MYPTMRLDELKESIILYREDKTKNWWYFTLQGITINEVVSAQNILRNTSTKKMSPNLKFFSLKEMHLMKYHGRESGWTFLNNNQEKIQNQNEKLLLTKWKSMCELFKRELS